MKDNEAEPLRYSMGAVVRRTGLKPELLRAWERRYGAVRPERTSGGQRVYSAGDLHRLQLLKTAVDSGHAISQVAPLSVPALEQLAAEAAPASVLSPEAYLAEAFQAVQQLDQPRLQSLLHHAAAGLPPGELLDALVLPLLRGIGERWAQGQLRPLQEHMASAVIRGVLELKRKRDAGGPVAVLGTPSGQGHEFGTLAAGLALSTTGWGGLYLGPDLPVGELVDAVRLTDAQALALGVGYLPETSTGRERLRAQGRALAAELPAGVALLVGGRAASCLSQGAGRRAVVLPDLPAWRQWLERARGA